MVASALGAHVVGPAGMGGAAASAVGAGLGRAAGLPMISLLDMIPIITTGAIATGAFDVMLGPGQIAVFAPSLPQPCAPHLARWGASVGEGGKRAVIGGDGGPPAALWMGDGAGGLVAVALGAILDKTGAVQAVNELSSAIAEKADQITNKVDEVLDKGLDTLDKTLDTAAGAVDKVAGVAGAALGKVGEMVGSVGSVMEAILGGAGLGGNNGKKK